MIYVIRHRCHTKIESFYRNVARKYKHTYSKQQLQRNVLDATNAIFKIENKLLRRRPTMLRWQREGWHMAHAGTWYYAYTVAGDTVTIEDACHELNMYDEART